MRKLERAGIEPEEGPPDLARWEALLRILDRAFVAGDEDRKAIQRDMADRSSETRALYRELSALGDARVGAERDKLESLLRAMTDGLGAVGAEGELLFVNEAGRTLCGLLGGDDPLAFSLSSNDEVDSASLSSSRTYRIAELIERTLGTGEIARAEGWVDGPAQLRRYLSCVSSPIGTGSQRSGAVLVFRDETEQRLASAQLEQAVVEACQAVEAKANFLATMSHEIRTPMNAVIGLTGLMLESTLDDRQRRHAETVRSSGEALLAIINDILDFSKLEAGQVQLEEIDFSLRECIDQVIDLLRQRAHASSIPLSVWVEPSLSDAFRSDPGRLRQILLNLVSNAIKFTQVGIVELRIFGRGDCVRFEVQDTGIGIGADVLDDVFTPFSQADPSTTRRFGGTGLGLAISKQLVETFGGRLFVNSTPGEGSCFIFEVPLTPTPAAQGRGGDAPRDPFSVLRRANALVVCADASARRGVCAHLEHLGVQHRAFESWPSEGRAGASLVIGDLGVPPNKHVDVRVGPAIDDRASLGELPRLEYPVAFARLSRAMRRSLGEETPDSGVLPAVVLKQTDPGRVLIVEDSVVNQLVARELLTHLGVRCDVVANGVEAVEAVHRVGYDLVLMDISMPVMDGFEATTAIRASEHKNIPIVAMTANAMQEDVLRCRQVGMQGHLAKPITLEKLRRMLAQQLSGAASSGTTWSRESTR
jgi:signal transduction histidine kinase/CheY-like chemotaxis protein